MKSAVLFVLRIYSLGDMFLLYSIHVTPIKKEDSPNPQTIAMCSDSWNCPRGLTKGYKFVSAALDLPVRTLN